MLPILGTDGLETNVESETGLIDMDDTTHNSPGGPGFIPTLPVGGGGGETVELSKSDPDAVVKTTPTRISEHWHLARYPARPAIHPTHPGSPDDWEAEGQRDPFKQCCGSGSGRIQIRSDPVFLGHPDLDLDPGKYRIRILYPQKDPWNSNFLVT